MFGDEIGGKIPENQKRYSFSHKHVWQRIAIVLAGPLMNFLFAILIFFVVANLGEEVRAPMVGDIPTDSVAYKAGFRSGDHLLKTNNEKMISWDQFQDFLSSHHDQKINVLVQREGAQQEVSLEVEPKLKPNPNILSLDSFIGDIDGLTYLSRAAAIGVKANSFAEKLGLKTGDRIVSINDKPIEHYRQVEPSLLARQGQEITITVERTDGKKSNHVKLTGLLPTISSLPVFGVESSDLYLAKVLENTPAYRAGLREGDRITKINAVEPKEWEDILQAVKSYQGQGALKIEVDRHGQNIAFDIAPQMTSQMNAQGGEEKRYTIGIMPLVYLAAPSTVTLASPGFVQSIGRGVERTWDVTVMTVVSFLRLIQAKISPKNIGGVLSIGQAASETFKIGIVHFLQMMAVISVNLFILNLLPIPVLDGGHLLFYSIEALRGAPVSMRKMEIAQQVGLVMLMSLMVFALFNDFSRLFGFW